MRAYLIIIFQIRQQHMSEGPLSEQIYRSDPIRISGAGAAGRDPASSALSGLPTNSRASVRQPTASPRTAGASSHRTTTPATMLRQFHRNRRAIMSKIKTDDGTEI